MSDTRSTNAENPAQAPTASFESVRPSTSVPLRLADYELLGEIARGAMGIVYRAKQLSLNRIVAVKIIVTGNLASASAISRFRDEAEAAASRAAFGKTRKTPIRLAGPTFTPRTHRIRFPGTLRSPSSALASREQP